MTKLQKIITETIDKFLLREYHHTTDNGLVDDCNLIYDGFKSMVEKGCDNGLWVNVPSIESRFQLSLTDKFKGAAIDSLKKIIYLNKTDFIKSLEDNNEKKEVLSNIYHELGHWVQIQKSDRLSIVSPSFQKPLFLPLKQDEYEKLLRKLYCFHNRELKARFYGTYMWLKQHNGENISIQDVYDSYACRLTPMREILSMLDEVAKEGEQGPRAFIIKNLYKETYCKNRVCRTDATFEKKAQRVIYYFTKRYNYFKKRIDKIFYDWKVSQGQNS